MTDEAKSGDVRAALRQVKRVVIKVGSRSLLAGEGRFDALAAAIAAQRAEGREVVLVNSGAIAQGIRRLGMSGRPRALPDRERMVWWGQKIKIG